MQAKVIVLVGTCAHARYTVGFSMAAKGGVDGDARTACVQAHAFRRDIFQECRHARCLAPRSARAQTVARRRLRLTSFRLRAPPLGARPVPRRGVCVAAAGTRVHIAGRAHVWLRLRFAPLHSEQESACMSLGLVSRALRRLRCGPGLTKTGSTGLTKPWS